ncbi:MAG TPA: cystathionine gamma-lyase [Mycobacteriales bacterium]|nr:cystathionine gamma-lyase [Mycobacteriales bacterium]
MRPGTRVVHAGLPEPVRGAPLLPSPVLASAYHLAGTGEGTDSYGRVDNPSWRAYEAAVGELEGGGAVVFSSGLAALAAVLFTTLRPGATVVLPADGYYLARRFVRERLAEWDVRVREVPTARPLTAADAEGAALVLLESPSNPLLDVCDLAAAAAVAHAAGAVVAVDNTTATALGQTPLALGADCSVSSDTKATTVHGDLVLGHVAVADPQRRAVLAGWRDQTGAVPGPLETWLAHRSLGTLELRLERQSANAAAIAELLAAHPAVQAVRYPGLPADPGHAVAARQMRRFGGLVSFVTADPEGFLAHARLVTDATSFGGLHTCADRRARWGDDVPPGLVRLSAGCEDPADLLADIGGALDAVVHSNP